MAAERASKNRSGNAGISAPVGWGRCSATCTQRFWLLSLRQHTMFPLVPGTLSPGKVRRRACGQHKSDWKNARKRGRTCPEALVCPEQERVCPKVGGKP